MDIWIEDEWCGLYLIRQKTVNSEIDLSAFFHGSVATFFVRAPAAGLATARASHLAP